MLSVNMIASAGRSLCSLLVQLLTENALLAAGSAAAAGPALLARTASTTTVPGIGYKLLASDATDAPI